MAYRFENCATCGKTHIAAEDAPKFWNCRRCWCTNETLSDGKVIAIYTGKNPLEG